jgi:eukaryotic-like serine/threonine-protein kinase
MTPERWQQVKGVLHQALEIAPDERSAFLDSARWTDHSLRREVESLLSLNDEARSSFFNSGIARVTLSEGTTLGEYEVQSLLGSGGMGEVYRARDLRLGRDVAIKVLPTFFASDLARLRRFEQEARAAAALNHPNILAVHQMGTYEGAPYLVSELLEGETLRARVKRGALPMPEAVDYALQITRGLAAAHEKGIVHRDLKPENLFITKDGQAKILDFGLAKHTRPEAGTDATEPGAVLGTVGYMSPEQVRGQTADARSDIFAFGAILYEMFSGRRAFTGESSADVASAILKDDPPRLSSSLAHIPKALDSTVQRCLEKNPEQRFQSGEEVAAALSAIGVLTSRRIAIPRRWPFLRSRAAVVTSVTFLAILAIAVIAVFYPQSHQASVDSIAVLPFSSKNADAGGELIGNGVTAGLIDSLSQIPNLRVMSRSSVSHYKGQEIDARTVGRELNVQTVLTGTITEHGDGFVLDAELINAGDGSHVWGHEFRQKTSDVLAVQAELVRTISDKVRPRLGSAEKSRLTNPGTSNPEAYSLYVRGRYFADRWDAEDWKKALGYFQQAVEKDAAYAQAYAGVAEAYSVLVFYGSVPWQDGIHKAKAAAHRALELNANLAEGHCGLAAASYVNREWEQAERESRRCVELNPNLFFAHQYHAFALESLGNMEQGLGEQKLALELDPVSVTANKFLGGAYYYSRDYDRAVEQQLKTMEFGPADPDLHDDLADSYLMRGEYDKAALEYERSLTLAGKSNWAKALNRAYTEGGVRGLLKTQIELWSDLKRHEDYDPDSVAKNYALLHDRENAFLWLDRAYADREKAHAGMLMDVAVNPQLDYVRSDPRYKALLVRLGFPTSTVSSR